MRWKIIGALLTLAATGAIIGTAFALFTASRTVSGEINLTTQSADLYICEPADQGPDPAASSPAPAACVDDDGTANETMFDTLEDVVPSGGDQTFTWDIRLVNTGDVPWDVTDFRVFTYFFTFRPSGCSSAFSLPASLRVLSDGVSEVNDNHTSGPQFDAVSPVFRHIGETTGTVMRVHVEPGEFEDFRVSLVVGDFGNACRGARFGRTTTISVTQDPS